MWPLGNAYCANGTEPFQGMLAIRSQNGSLGKEVITCDQKATLQQHRTSSNTWHNNSTEKHRSHASCFQQGLGYSTNMELSPEMRHQKWFPVNRSTVAGPSRQCSLIPSELKGPI